MILEPVFLRTDEQQTGTIHELQALHGGIAAQLGLGIVSILRVEGRGDLRRSDRCHIGGAGVVRIRLLECSVADPFGLDHLAQVVPEFVGIHMFQLVGLCDDAGIIVVPDKVQHVCIRFDRYDQLRLDPGAVIRPRIAVVGVPRHARNGGGGEGEKRSVEK